MLLPEVLEALQPGPGRRYIDATLGGGGHAEKMLELSSPDGVLLGIDVDPDALRASKRRLAPFGSRVTYAEGFFNELLVIARGAGFTLVDGILFDLGVSSPQLDTAERGFSFQHDAPLDMRLGPTAQQSAQDLVNSLNVDELQHIFQVFGEERYAGRIARRIVEQRSTRPIRTTGELARIVVGAVPHSHGDRIHPATRVFQALRIATNDELRRLQRALPQAVQVLREGGRLAVISFHSLEDRIVKQFMRQESRECICPPELPVCQCNHQPSLRSLTPRPLQAKKEEVLSNPRARSAKLRVAERVCARDIAEHKDSEKHAGGGE